MSTVYGPVPSWRLGRSLGIDVITPPKRCTFNCIYCQLGRTRVYISGPEGLNENLVSSTRVLDDLDPIVKRIDLKTVDVVTFSGTGEPTLNLTLGNIVTKVKSRIGAIPLAILSNSSLFYRGEIRKFLRQFDLVVAKLDAGDDETFRLINRPADHRLDVETLSNSIKRLRKEFEGVLALEVMLLSATNREITNVEGSSLRRLLDAILDVEPDLVQLEVPYRPPAENYVKLPSQERITSISRELAEGLGEDKVWVYGLHDKRGKRLAWFTHESLENEALALLKRRPCRVVDISVSLGIGLPTAKSILKKLEEQRVVAVEESNEERYYSYCS